MFTGLGMGCRANWEMESANIPGLVGGWAGGGHLQQRATGFYPRVATLVLLIYFLVISSDVLSDRLSGRRDTA
jgi:hypothetical protein